MKKEEQEVFISNVKKELTAKQYLQNLWYYMKTESNSAVVYVSWTVSTLLGIESVYLAQEGRIDAAVGLLIMLFATFLFGDV